MSDKKVRLFHYTGEPALKKIQKDGQIKPSVDTGQDARFGPAVYLTELPPETPTYELSRNNYGNLDGKYKNLEVGIEVEVPRADVVKKRADGRDVWVHKKPIPENNFKAIHHRK